MDGWWRALPVPSSSLPCPALPLLQAAAAEEEEEDDPGDDPGPRLGRPSCGQPSRGGCDPAGAPLDPAAALSPPTGDPGTCTTQQRHGRRPSAHAPAHARPDRSPHARARSRKLARWPGPPGCTRQAGRGPVAHEGRRRTRTTTTMAAWRLRSQSVAAAALALALALGRALLLLGGVGAQAEDYDYADEAKDEGYSYAYLYDYEAYVAAQELMDEC
eukprot:scaffold1104_cov299-Prasinococcus_capsulatus_cf.AAC.1